MARPSLGAFFANFGSYDAPLLTKVQLAIKNNVTKARTGKGCCGHPGEPGC